MATNLKLQYLHEVIEAGEVGIDIVSSLQVLEDLQPSQILQLCIQLARQFLPLYEYHVPLQRNHWVRTALNRMQRGEPLESMSFIDPFELPFRPASDLDSALYSYHEGMVFLSIAVDVQADFLSLVRKASISIGHFVYAIVQEFCGARWQREWKYNVDESGIEELWIMPRSIAEMRTYEKSIWLNIADEIETFLIKNR